MLKQEEALAELDASIDDWVAKLDQAENRRTRVRQKLLEHVAAAVTLPATSGGVMGVSESLHLAMGIKSPVTTISTPERSPTKVSFAERAAAGSPSPQRVVGQVPSTILEQPLVEEAASVKGQEAASIRRVDVESIRVYAGDDVYTLLADVENEITKMSRGETGIKDENLSEEELKKLHRAHSHELLSGGGLKKTSPPDSPRGESPRPESPTLSDSPTSAEIFLTNAVFRPAQKVWTF